MAQLEKMMDEIKGMTVLELNELVKALEEEFGAVSYTHLRAHET